MLTIMSGMSPTPRLRSGFQSAASSVQPSAALSTRAMMIASQIGNARSTPNVRTISAPNVTISACAKLESPVVPKISERPIAASASRSPKFSPLMTRMSTWALMSVVVRVPSPRKKFTALRLVRPNSAVTGFWPSATTTPSGRVSSSSVSSYSPFSGTPIDHRPSASVSVSAS